MSIATQAQRNVRRYGRPFTIRMRTSGTYDPTTGQTSPAVNTDYADIPAILASPGQMQVAGSLMTFEKPTAIFAFLDMPVIDGAHVIPAPTSVIIDGPKKYQISAVDTPEIQGGPVVVVCKLQG